MPVLLYIQMAWALGLGLWLAPYNAQFRDVKLIVPLIIQLYYFASPILYAPSVAPSWILWLYKINPLATVITAYRSMLNGAPLDWFGLFFAFLFSTAVLSCGAYVFMQKERAMVDVL
jgi:lipopolysaccharide transport system permease protein